MVYFSTLVYDYSVSESIRIATQGGEFSYHAVAARQVALGREVEIVPYDRFGEVVRASREYCPGLGVIAIGTVAGTVDDSAREIVRKRPSALPPIVGRTDVNIELALIGSSDQSIEDLNRRGVRCLAQKPAATQCSDFLSEYLPWIKVCYRGESTKAIAEAIDQNNPDVVAIGPKFAAEVLGGFVLGGRQINPEGSVTSFYVLQRDPRQEILAKDPKKTSPRSVVSLAHPEGEGEMEKCLDVIHGLGVSVMRYIPFAIGDFTKHDGNLRRGGGLLELGHDLYDAELTEACARINALSGNDNVRGPFSTKRLGGFMWYPEEPVELGTLTT